MLRIFLYLFLTVLSFNAFSQKKEKAKKPQVLVYGHAADAFAAAVQACQSGVETLWVIDSTTIGGSLVQGNQVQIDANYKLDVGIWALFLKGIANVDKITDSASAATKRNISPRIAQNVFEQFSDTLKRLQVRENKQIRTVEKAGENWKVTLSDGEKIKVSALVDASSGASLYAHVAPESFDKRNIKSSLDNQEKSFVIDYSNPLYRTGVAVSDLGGKAFSLPLACILPDSVTNYFTTRSLSSTAGLLSHSKNDIPLLMLQAQACGAAAAYCAFFKTASDQINVRTLQGELLAFNSELIPLQDITLDDLHYTQIQRIAATGLLKGTYETIDDKPLFLFHPDSLVSSKEIEPIMKALYTRSQIWFKDKNIPVIHLKEALDLIKYVALRGDELNAEVKKGWKKRFHFTGEYDTAKAINRRQLAVLIDTYLQPFNVRITLKGDYQY